MNKNVVQGVTVTTSNVPPSLLKSNRSRDCDNCTRKEGCKSKDYFKSLKINTCPDFKLK